MQLKMSKQYGSAFMNLFRQVMLTGIESARPVAFSVGHASNVLEIADSVEEDMTTFIHNVCDNSYVAAGSGDMFVCRWQSTGCLSASAFASCGVTPLREAELLHFIGDIYGTVVFRNACGSFTSMENALWLDKHGIASDQYVVIPSRHCDVADFRYTESRKEGDVIYDLNLRSLSGKTEEKLVETVKSKIRNLLDEV